MKEVKNSIIQKAIDEKKGENIVIYDVSGKNPFYDTVIIATIMNSRQASGIIDEISKKLSLIKEEVNHVEGDTSESEWILIDCNGVVVHLFTEQERLRVNIEQLLSKNK